MAEDEELNERCMMTLKTVMQLNAQIKELKNSHNKHQREIEVLEEELDKCNKRLEKQMMRLTKSHSSLSEIDDKYITQINNSKRENYQQRLKIQQLKEELLYYENKKDGLIYLSVFMTAVLLFVIML